MDRTKILLVCREIGRADRVELSIVLSEHLAGRGAAVTLAYPVDSAAVAQYTALGFYGISLDTYRPNDPAVLSALVERNAPDLLIAWQFPVEQVDKIAARYPSLSAIVFPHPDDYLAAAPFSQKKPDDFFGFFSHVLLQNAPLRVSSSALMRADPTRKTIFIPFPLSADLADEMPEDQRNAKRESLGVRESDILIETLYSTEKETDVACVAAAVLALRRARALPLMLMVICREEEISAVASALKGICDPAELATFLRYYPLNTAERASHFLSELATHSAAREEFPDFALEMLSLGKPVVNVNHPAAVPIAKYLNTLLYDRGDVSELCRAICRALEMPRENGAMAAAVRSDFSREQWLFAVFSRIVECVAAARLADSAKKI